MLSRLHWAGVHINRPTGGIDAIQLFHHFLGGDFVDVAEHRISERRHYAGEGRFSKINYNISLREFSYIRWEELATQILRNHNEYNSFPHKPLMKKTSRFSEQNSLRYY